MCSWSIDWIVSSKNKNKNLNCLKKTNSTDFESDFTPQSSKNFFIPFHFFPRAQPVKEESKIVWLSLIISYLIDFMPGLIMMVISKRDEMNVESFTD